MSDELSLSEVFTNEGVRAFGQALRFALRDDQSPDFSSLVELEYVETKDGFADVLKSFLRRYETQTRRREQRGQPTFHPNQTHLEALMEEVDRVGVRPVRAALIAHALVYSTKKPTTLQAQATEGGK
jgi:hypothetical protein